MSRRATSGNAPSSTSNNPRSASRVRRRVEATPETRFAPESLCATRTLGRRISATIAAVVVFPFVAETSTEPWESRRAKHVDRARIELPEELAGQRRPAAAAGDARERAGRAHGRRLDARAGSVAASPETVAPFPQRSELLLDYPFGGRLSPERHPYSDPLGLRCGSLRIRATEGTAARPSRAEREMNVKAQ